MIISKSKFKHIPEAWEIVQAIADITADGGDEFSQVDQLRSVIESYSPKLDDRFNSLLGPLDTRIEEAVLLMVRRGVAEQDARKAIRRAIQISGEDSKAGELASFAAGCL